MYQALTFPSPTDFGFDLISCTSGIITLGIPFKGIPSKLIGAAEIQIRLAEVMGGETCTKLIESLKRPDRSLDKTVAGFASLINKSENNIQLRCFYETSETNVYANHLRRMRIPFADFFAYMLGGKSIVVSA